MSQAGVGGWVGVGVRERERERVSLADFLSAVYYCSIKVRKLRSLARALLVTATLLCLPS